MGHFSKQRACAAAAVIAIGWVGYAAADTGTAAQGEPSQDLGRLSLEDLAKIKVTSVSRRPEALAQAAASIFVITRDDILRSGAASLPEVLRLAPNLNVQRVNAVDYAITARGFNGFETSNKLLVLVDGRSIYSTLSSGVFWDARDLPLEDIERIEIISGPGGTLYGANAMNGVINIISRAANETTGAALAIGVGNEDSTFSLRHGGALGQVGAWRAYINGFSRDDSFRLTGGDATDAAHGLQGGARFDWGSGPSRLTVQGDVFDNRVAINEDFSGVDTTVRGGNIQGRWSRDFVNGEFEAQTYYDRFEREEPGSLETADHYDIALQHAFSLAGHQIVVGGGHRVVVSNFRTEAAARLNPSERTLRLTNLFAQDRLALSDSLALTIGAKLEDNSFSGQEFLPSIRLAWELPSGDLLWGAVSRATRTPNRIERDLTLPGFLVGGSFESETLTAYEAGYRAGPSRRASLSASVFYNRYDQLRTTSLDPLTILPLRLANFGAGETYGVEVWGSYELNPRWRMSGGLTTLHKDFEVDPAGTDISQLASAGDDPNYQAILKSQADLTDRLNLDLKLRAVDALSSTDAYVEADARLGWRLRDDLELSVSGQNLLQDRHVETGDPARRRAFGRSVYATLRLGF